LINHIRHLYGHQNYFCGDDLSVTMLDGTLTVPESDDEEIIEA